MAQKPSIPKGTRDFSPLEMARRNYIFDTIKSVFSLYGFQQREINCSSRFSIQAIGKVQSVMRHWIRLQLAH